MDTVLPDCFTAAQREERERMVYEAHKSINDVLLHASSLGASSIEITSLKTARRAIIDIGSRL